MIQMYIQSVETLIACFNEGKITEEDFYRSLQNTAKLGLDDIRKHKIWDMKGELRPGDMVTVDHKKVAGRTFKVKEVKRVKVIVVNPDNAFESFIVPLSLVKKA